MSPTCTIPYEVLFEFINDTSDTATMQVLRREDGSRTGATLLMHRGENLSLVLTAGSAYKYTIKQRGEELIISVKVWQDTQCTLSAVFSGSLPTQENNSSAFLTENGVKITSRSQ